MRIRIVIIGICIVYIILSIASASNGGDFDVSLDAAIKLSNHQNIYAPPFIKGLQYYYSPLFALLLIPFSSNFFIIELLWLLLSGFLLFRIFVLVKSYLDLSFFSAKDKLLLITISSFFVIRFVLYNVGMIQITVFLLWAIFESINLIQNKKNILGSIILAFAINIKLMPLIALPYLLYRQKYKSSALVLVLSALYLILPSLFIGYDFNSFLLIEWWDVINPLNSEHLIEAGTNAQSLVGLVPVFLTETNGQIDISRNLLSLSTENAVLITNIIRLTLVALTLWFLKSPFIKKTDSLNEIRALGYICLLVPMIFPHQQKYAFIFLYPIIMYLTYYCIILWKYDWNKKSKIYVFSLLSISVILSPIIGSDIIGRYTYDLIHHFRLLGITVLILIIYTAIANPQNIRNLKTPHNKEYTAYRK